MATIWDRIKAALEPKTAVPEQVEHQLRMATGALLLEMCRADLKVLPEERSYIVQSIKEAFKLTKEETRELIEAAEAESECAVSINIYTSLINEFSSSDQKQQLIADLWHVAYADGELHVLEENLIERVAHLIAVPAKRVERIRQDVRSQSVNT